MEGTFKGRISMDDGGDLEVDLQISETRLSIASGTASICSLPLAEYQVTTADGLGFDLMVDGDSVHFVPDDPGLFSEAIATFPSGESSTTPPGSDSSTKNLALHRVPELEPVSVEPIDDEGWISEDIVESQRSLRQSKSTRRFTSAGIKKGALTAATVAVVGIAALQAPKVIASVDLGSLFASPESTATTVASTTTTTSAGSTTTTSPSSSTSIAAVASGVFAVSSDSFIDSWNKIGGDISAALRFPAYPPAGESRMDFTSYIWMSTVVDEAGRLKSFTLSIDPSGPTNSDILGVNALGVVLAVTEPDLDGPGRKTVLASLGFDVEKPNLDGVDSEVVRNGIDYLLRYDNKALTFTVSSAS